MVPVVSCSHFGGALTICGPAAKTFCALFPFKFFIGGFYFIFLGSENFLSFFIESPCEIYSFVIGCFSGNMSSEFYYSDKYEDEEFEYR